MGDGEGMRVGEEQGDKMISPSSSHEVFTMPCCMQGVFRVYHSRCTTFPSCCEKGGRGREREREREGMREGGRAYMSTIKG